MSTCEVVKFIKKRRENMKKAAIFKRVLSIVTSAVVVATTVLSGSTAVYAADADFKQVVKPDHMADKQISATFNPSDFGYYFTSSLGTPGYFHVFASGRYTQTGHVHGNIASKYYNPDGKDSGIRTEYPVNSVDYAQNIESNINFSDGRDYFIMGSKYSLDNSANQAQYNLTDGANTYATINNRPYFLAVDKDSNSAPFINFEKEQAAMVQKSKTAAAAETTKYLVINDENRGGILLDTSAGDSIYVVNLTYEQIKNWAQIHIKTADLSAVDEVTQEITDNFKGNTYSVFNFGDTSKTVIVNIDMGGNADRRINAQVHGRYEGPSMNGNVTRNSMVPGETAILLTSCNVLWNLHSNGEAYTGTATFANNWFGMILAPAAGLFMEASADGSFICRDFSHRSETHAWYYTGAFPTAFSEEEPELSEETSSSSEETSSSSEDSGSDEGGEGGSETPGSGEIPALSSIMFVKTNETGTTTLEGAKFVLYGDANCTVAVGQPVISNAEGIVSFGEIQDGTYYLREEAAPQGYKTSSQKFLVIVNDGNVEIQTDGSNLKGSATEGYQIANDRRKVSIQLIKTYAGENVDVEALLGDTKFTLYGAYDGVTFTNSFGTVSPVWDNVEQKAIVTFNNVSVPLEEADVYYLVETQSPGGYTTSDKVFECRVDVNGDVTYRLYGSGEAFAEEFPVCINELEEENTEESTEESTEDTSEDSSEGESSSSSSSGSDDGEEDEDESSSSSSSGNDDGEEDEGESSSSSSSGNDDGEEDEDESSSSSSSGNDDGEEDEDESSSSSSSGNDDGEEDEDESSSSSSSGNDDGEEDEDESSSSSSSGNDDGEEDEDESSSSSSSDEGDRVVDIKLIKTNDDATVLLEGAEFTLFADANCSVVVAKAVTGSNGVAVLKDISDGTYFMKETVAPAGYKVNEEVYSVRIEQGQATITAADNVSDSISGNVTDGYIIRNYAITSEIRLVKQYEAKNLSNEELLRNTEFTLYRAYNGTELSGKISSANPIWDQVRGIAVVSFENVKVPTDNDVIYYLKETKSPSEYTRSNDVYECKIDTEGNVTYRVYGSDDEYSATFPICNNLLVADPVEPEVPSEDDSDENGSEGSSSSDNGSDEEDSDENGSEGNSSSDNGSDEEDSDENGSEGNSSSDNGSDEDDSDENGSEENSSSENPNPEDGSDNPGDGNENDSDDNSEENGSEDDSDDDSEENGSENNSDDDSEENGSENNSDDDSEENGSEDSSKDSTEKKKNNKKKDASSSSEESPKKDLDDVPKTGDNFSILLFFVIAVVSAAGMFLGFRGMKKDEQYEIRF